jgi:hypothetical protein
MFFWWEGFISVACGHNNTLIVNLLIHMYIGWEGLRAVSCDECRSFGSLTSYKNDVFAHPLALMPILFIHNLNLGDHFQDSQLKRHVPLVYRALTGRLLSGAVCLSGPDCYGAKLGKYRCLLWGAPPRNQACGISIWFTTCISQRYMSASIYYGSLKKGKNAMFDGHMQASKTWQKWDLLV